jgi:hypothetical protein
VAKIGPRPDFARRYEDLEEQVRLLRLRAAKGVEPVEDWQSLEPYLDPQWITTGPTLGFDWDHARFYKDRERVYFAGRIESQVAGASSPVTSMPSGYITSMIVKHQLPVDGENSPTSTHNKVWVVKLVTGGKWELEQHVDFMASPLFGAPPQFTTLFLHGVSYRIA